MKIKRLAIPALTIALAVPCGLTATAYAAAPAQYGYQDRAWDQAPDDFRDAKRQGFHEGVEAARRDFERRRHKDADDHDVYKHPPVDRAFRDDFREGFRRGYEVAMRHMRDEHHDHDRDDRY